jgi:aldehyde dehydrogenase (NAD+)
MELNMEHLARLETIAMGKPMGMLLGFDIPHMIGCYRCKSFNTCNASQLIFMFRADYAGWADKIEGDSFNAEDGIYRIVSHEPLGVCAGVASWNSTFLYAAWKIAPALAAGNVVSSMEKFPPLSGRVLIQVDV